MICVLVLGASGMLGSAVFKLFAQSKGFEVVGSVRSTKIPIIPINGGTATIIPGCNVESHDDLIKIFSEVKPDIVINCIGVVKQKKESNSPVHTIPINSMLPHRLASLCGLIGARLIHISTDCVFSGKSGNYNELDQPDAEDMYGRTKLLGEVGCKNAITVRTSIVGHELSTSHSLVEWFLSQCECVDGFTNAIFSGLPTVELAKVLRDFVIPNPTLTGVYHVSSDPISKYDLLSLIRDVYGKKILIRPNGNLTVNRSLDSTRFRSATGYIPSAWPILVREMYLSK
jgi:dTDP-4-dehydrorhamnose reductase